MGRWAQQKRAGGGPQTLAYMHEITRAGSDVLDVEFSQVVNASQLTAADFVSLEGGTPADTAVQLSPTTITFSFPLPVDDDASLFYAGATPGLISPQNKLIS